MMKSRPFTCGLEVALAVIAGKWKPLILFHLLRTTMRYGDLRRAVGAVSHKVLSQQLKEMEIDGIVRRVDYQEIPPRVDYSLTPFGLSLARSFGPLCEWGTAHTAEVEQALERRIAHASAA